MTRERERQTRRDQKGRILKKGEGQDKNGRYYYIYTDTSGNRRRMYNLNLMELRKAEKAIQKDIADGIDLSAAKRTLNEQFAIYLATKEIRESTRAHYVELWNRRVKNDIGTRKIIDLKKSDLQMFFKKLADNGYADSTIKTYCNNMIKPALELALDDDIIRKNPAKGCMKEYNRSPETKKALTVAEQEAFLDFVEKSEQFCIYYPLFVVMFSTACRRSEIIGLTWEDIDFEAKSISINHQLLYKNLGTGNAFHYAEPKSEAGIRTIPMTQKCYKALIQQKEIQLSLGIKHNVKVGELSNFVFTTLKSTPHNPGNLNNLLKNIVGQYNKKQAENTHMLPHITCHSFRHTGCTRLAESGVDPKTLQKFMGHSDISVTMNIYNHVDKERMEKEIRKAERNSNVI